MQADAPLTSNERALTLSVLIVGALIALFTLFTIASSLVIVTTGKAMGSEMTQAFAKGFQKDPQMQEMMERQLQLQTEIQKRWAPVQLVSEGAYLLAVAGTIAFAAIALRGGRARSRLGWAALAASGVRVGTGVVTYLFTSELMKVTTGSIFASMQKGSRGLSPEKADDIQRFTKGAMAGVSAASAGCVTLIVCIYFAVVAYVFLARKKPEATAAAPGA